MITRLKTIVVLGTLAIAGLPAIAQQQWSLNDCINYALEQNISVKQAGLSTNKSEVYLTQTKSSRLPSLNASVNQNFNWMKSYDFATNSYGAYNPSDNQSLSINSSVNLYNGGRINQQVRQQELILKSSVYDSQTIKESVSVQILTAYLQVLYAHESVTNAKEQIVVTESQLQLAEERLRLGAVSQSDYLQIKSELASEKLTLANAQSNLDLARISLMQLMELPVNNSFDISSPKLDSLLNQSITPSASDIYSQAIGFKPQIQSVLINTESAKIEEKIAKTGYLPTLSLSAAVGSNFVNQQYGYSYPNQINNKMTPSVSLSLSIPIFQKNQVKSSVSIARIGVDEARLQESNTRNQLRKEIEQACADVVNAQAEYQANVDKYAASTESYSVATEKFKVGMMNSVDYLYEKNTLIKSESSLTQAKYTLVFRYKLLDFYKGIQLTL